MQSKIAKSNEKLQTKIVSDSWNTYILEATIWTPESLSKWAITKIDASWNTTFPVDTANNTPLYAFRFLPADVLTYTYWYSV